jgi:hypothetical protein
MKQRHSPLALLFAITLFVSAALLFSVQPMVAKMLLPLLGGTPSVWNTCIVFFQAVLLVGYGYAVIVSKWRFRPQIFFQLLFLVFAVVSLPIGLTDYWLHSVPTTGNPSLWLLTCLAAIVGLPFFILSSNGPLLQKWFADSNDESAADPYFLYSASNAGSLIALLSYPVLIEPQFVLHSQSRLWAGAYAFLVLLVGLCGLVLWRLQDQSNKAAQGSRLSAPITDAVATGIKTVDDLSAKRRGRWILLAFVPSSLMLGVTNYISTDIASVPLLWVVPLALYLLTLVLAFARRELVPLRILIFILPALTIGFLIIFAADVSFGSKQMIGLHLLYFFIAALTSHQLLASDRPSTDHLPEFYFWLSLGGVLGGIFNALLAPLIFNSVAEYPLVMLLVCLLLPVKTDKSNPRRALLLDFVIPTLVLVLILSVTWTSRAIPLGNLAFIVMVLACPIFFVFRERPVRFVLCLAVVMIGVTLASGINNPTLYAERNFFGVLRVMSEADNTMHSLFHGSTIHGRQSMLPDRLCEPLAYYHREGPLGEIFGAFHAVPRARNEVAVVGLGTGATASYSRADEVWTFYEINPAVVNVARDPKYFTYLSGCTAAPVSIVLGDARLRLRDAPDARYGLIVLDAFSSDSIPVHLITQQALDLYLSKLVTDGLLAFHISNRNLDLTPVVADLAASRNLECIGLYDLVRSVEGKNPSIWVVMARHPADTAQLSTSTYGRVLTSASNRVPWTDDFSNILSVFRWR